VPFTFSHPAIVLPLTVADKRRYSVTAITIGSITPDFEYFFRFQQQSTYSHTWLGVFWYDLPIAVVLFFLFNKIVKDELIDSLPVYLNKRFERFKHMKRITYTQQKYLIVLTSLLIGIASHLLWDKVTHRTGRLGDEQMEFYTFLWDANSVVGALIIAFLISRMPKGKPDIKRSNFLFWFLILLTTLIVMIIRSAYSTNIRDIGISFIAGLFIGLIFSSLINKFISNKTKRGNYSPAVA
jgi:hypothetical protein